MTNGNRASGGLSSTTPPRLALVAVQARGAVGRTEHEREPVLVARHAGALVCGRGLGHAVGRRARDEPGGRKLELLAAAVGPTRTITTEHASRSAPTTSRSPARWTKRSTRSLSGISSLHVCRSAAVAIGIRTSLPRGASSVQTAT